MDIKELENTFKKSGLHLYEPGLFGLTKSDFKQLVGNLLKIKGCRELKMWIEKNGDSDVIMENINNINYEQRISQIFHMKNGRVTAIRGES